MLLLITICMFISLIPTALSSTYGCHLFSNRFTVANGVFKDVCGSQSVSTNSQNLNSNRTVFPVTDGTVLTLSPPAIFESYHFSIVIHGKRLPSTNGVPYDIILGPGSKEQSDNCQIRYEDGNKLGIYCYYKSSTYWQPDIALSYDVDELHTLILHYEDRNLHIYQNNQWMTNIFSAELDLAFGRIGGWFRDNSPADIGIINIMFAFDQSLADIRDFVKSCGLYQDDEELMDENPCWVDQTKQNGNGNSSSGNGLGLQPVFIITGIFAFCVMVGVWVKCRKCCCGKKNGDRSREAKKQNKKKRRNSKKKNVRAKRPRNAAADAAAAEEGMEDAVVMDRLNEQREGDVRRGTDIALSMHIENHEEVQRKTSEAEPMREESVGNNRRKECIVCMDAKREYALMPCKHFILCKQCVLQIDDKCPVCRSKYTSTVKVRAHE